MHRHALRHYLDLLSGEIPGYRFVLKPFYLDEASGCRRTTRLRCGAVRDHRRSRRALRHGDRQHLGEARAASWLGGSSGHDPQSAQRRHGAHRLRRLTASSSAMWTWSERSCHLHERSNPARHGRLRGRERLLADGGVSIRPRMPGQNPAIRPCTSTTKSWSPRRNRPRSRRPAPGELRAWVKEAPSRGTSAQCP